MRRLSSTCHLGEEVGAQGPSTDVGDTPPNSTGAQGAGDALMDMSNDELSSIFAYNGGEPFEFAEVDLQDWEADKAPCMWQPT